MLPSSTARARLHARLHQRQPQQKARALGAVGLGADASRRAPARSWPRSKGPARCRDAWWSRRAETAAREFHRSARGRCRRLQPQPRAIFAERGANAEHAQQAALHGLGGIVDQVGQRAREWPRDRPAPSAGPAPDRLCTVMPSSRPANSASASSATLFMSQARGCGAGNCASAENWSTSVRKRAHAAQNHLAALADHVRASPAGRAPDACRCARRRARWA